MFILPILFFLAFCSSLSNGRWIAIDLRPCIICITLRYNCFLFPQTSLCGLMNFILDIIKCFVLIIEGITSKNVTIENKCDFTVWPGILTTNGPVSTTTTGFVLKKGEARVINASSWVAYYYVWGRRFCSTNSSGSFSCMIGDCGSGKIECSGGYYTPPVTLAQFRLGYTDGKDRHLVSVAKGYNLPMRVVPLPQGNETCSSNECIVDLNTTCPPELRVTSNTSLRQTVACMSGCQKLDMPEYCCSGPYANDKCMPTLYSQNFKSACPHASTINFEDNSYVACANTTNYVITFCPSTSLNNTK